MRKICYSVAMSLDGYVAGPEGQSDWIVMDPEIDFMALFGRFDTVLMGRKTFEVAKARGQGGAMPGVTSVVISRTLQAKDHPGVTVLGDNLEKELKRIRSEPGKDIWLFGGGSLFRSLLEMGQVDTIETAIIPVLLGGGVPLLPAMAKRTKLRLESSKALKKTGTMSLVYAVERKGK